MTLNKVKRRDKLEKIKEVIKNAGVLYYKGSGYLINPRIKENKIFGTKEVVSWWYDKEDDELHLGHFVDLENIEIKKEKNKLL